MVDVAHGANVNRPDVNLRAELEELTSTVCRALNDPKRLALLYALAGGPHSVSELCALLEVSQSNISQHLSMLRDRGLVDTQRHGNRVIYTLRDRRVVEAIDLLRSVMNDDLSRRQALRHADETPAVISAAEDKFPRKRRRS